MTGHYCESCDRLRSPDELLEVVSVRTGHVFYVCRPGLSGRCFRRVGSALVHRIREASPRKLEPEPPGTRPHPARDVYGFEIPKSSEPFAPKPAPTSPREESRDE